MAGGVAFGGGSLLLWDCGPLACDPDQGQPCVRVWPEAEGRLFNFTVTASLEVVLQVVRLALLGLVMVTTSEPMSGWYHIGTSHAFSQILKHVCKAGVLIFRRKPRTLGLGVWTDTR